MIAPILMYHSISTEADPRFARWVVPPDLFERHLAALKSNGFIPLSISDLRLVFDGALTVSGRPIAITFDDGFADFRTTALPILRQFGFPATLFVTTAYLDDTSRWLSDEGEADRPMLSAADLLPIAAQGIEIGGHGHSHAMLDLLPGGQIEFEIEATTRRLEHILGERVKTFAYPHGHADKRVRRALAERGYETACTVTDRLASTDDDSYYMPRLIVGPDASPEQLLCWTRGDGRSTLTVTRRAQAFVGRLWRSRYVLQQRRLATREAA